MRANSPSWAGTSRWRYPDRQSLVRRVIQIPPLRREKLISPSLLFITTADCLPPPRHLPPVAHQDIPGWKFLEEKDSSNRYGGVDDHVTHLCLTSSLSIVEPMSSGMSSSGLEEILIIQSQVSTGVIIESF